MTKEEIKEKYSMREIIARYGLYPNRAGFISCPFHKGDREASMKIYDKDFHCFGCGANGDIFAFVQRMEGIPFREAFQCLGGTYQSPTFSSQLAIYRAKKRQEMRQKEKDREAQERLLNIKKIEAFQKQLEKLEPLSEEWCECYNALQYQLYVHGELNGIPY